MKFSKRTSYPAKDNKYYFDKSINPWTACGLKTCTRYTQGRIMECTKDTKRRFKDVWFPVDMLAHCKEVGAKKVSKPTLGGFGVWANNSLKTGHCANIEVVESNGDIWISQVSREEVFSYVKLTKKSGYKNGEYELVGFADLQVKWDSATTQTTTPTVTPEPAKKELTADSYPDYKTNGDWYRVRDKWGSGGKQLGAYAIFHNAFSCYTQHKKEGYHIFDKDGKQLD